MPQQRTERDTRRLTLLGATAEALAVPEMICNSRNCRRRRTCLLYRHDTDEPACLNRLRPFQRALFDELYDIAMAIGDGVQPSRASADPERRALEETASDIVRAVLGKLPEIKQRFAAWRQRYGELAESSSQGLDGRSSVDAGAGRG
jgi:hypothetical protein